MSLGPKGTAEEEIRLYLVYSTGQAKATNFIAPKIDFLGAIRCQNHSQGG